MSDYRNRVSSARRSTKEKLALGKENIFITKQTNKLAGSDFQKIVPRKRSFSADLGCDCNCNCGVNNNVVFNEIKSSTKKKTPFRIHIDLAGNDLGRGARFRERIVQYDTRRIENLKKNARDSQTKVERTEKPEINLVQDPPQDFKRSDTISRNFRSRNSIISGSQPIIKSIRYISKPRVKISTAKSLVDLCQINKPSTSTNDTAKLNEARITPVERNLVKKRSRSSSSISKSNNLADGWNPVPLRTTSSSNHLTVFPTRNRIVSIGSTNEVLNNVQKKQLKSVKSEKLGGSKDSLVSHSSAVLSSNSTKEQFTTAVEDYQIVENTTASCNSNHKVTLSSTKEKSNDRKQQPLIDAIQEKVQAKVESEVQVIQQNTDFSAYLLYHTDYLLDLLTIEKEKEENSQKLSSDFIDKYMNSDARKIVVTFLIRLTTHCRYPSFILYQAIKIFDATIDRISIEESDLQLAAVTALWIVLKKDGNFNKIPSAKSMLGIAQGLPQENANILIEWEQQILRILNFNITFSDPFSIFVFYVINYDYQPHGSSDIITKIYYCGGYIIDLTLLDAKFSYTTSNYLGLITAELVMSIILDDEANLSSPRWRYWRSVITNGVHVPISYYDDEINVLRATIISHILESAKKHTKEEVVRKRYSHNRYGNISEFFINKIKKLPPKEYSMCM